MIAAGHETFGGVEIGFLDKSVDPTHAVNFRGCFAGGDVAKAGFRRAGMNAEGDQIAGLCRCSSFQRGGAKGGHILDHVIGWQHEHDRIRAAVEEPQGGCGQRRSGIAAQRFENDALSGVTLSAQLFGHHEAVVFVADDENGGKLVRLTGAHGRGLQHGVVPVERQELFGVVAAAHGPQSGSRPARQNDGGDQTGCQDTSPLFAHLLAGFCPND